MKHFFIINIITATTTTTATIKSHQIKAKKVPI